MPHRPSPARNTALALATALLAALLVLRLQQWPVAADVPPPPPIVHGEIALPGVTGAAMLPGGRLFLTTAGPNGAALLPSAVERLQKPPLAVPETERLEPLLGGKVSLDALVDAAWDGRDALYVVTSHGRNRLGDSPEERYRLARLGFDASGKLLEPRQSAALLKAVVEGIPFLADAVRRPPARAGLNIGGLAWSPEGHLLIGLRSPTVTESAPRPHGGQEDAVVLRLTNPQGVFGSPAGAAELADVVKLDLHGQGIHGLCWDAARKGWWIVSGLSPEPNHQVRSPWVLWFWDGEHPPKAASLPPGLDLEAPEAVALVETGGRPSLLLIDGGKTASRYALFPEPAAP